MRVLVTGGLGYVGRVVAARLAEAGHEVTALTSSAAEPRRGPPEGVGVARADLLDRRRLARVVAEGGFAGVCHLAARTRVRESFADPLGTFAVNLTGTLHLLDALAGRGQPARLVLASTGAVYGPGAPVPAGEDAPAAPTNPYAASKLAAEQLVGFQAATGALAAVSLRCFNVAGAVGGHGDRDLSRLLPKALAVAKGGADRLEVNGDGSAVRELVHVADLADAYLLALESAWPGCHEVYNVGSGTGVRVRELVAAVERVTGRPVAVVHGPPRDEPAVLVADSARIAARLGWRPRRSDLDRIVADAWAAT
jgi:UDP-glucose 4-epimerase